jgi:hypothetical protein
MRATTKRLKLNHTCTIAAWIAFSVDELKETFPAIAMSECAWWHVSAPTSGP